MFQQNIVITDEDNVNHHLDFILVENNSKRWNLVFTNKWGGGMKVQQPQPIPTIINRYAVVDKLQSESGYHIIEIGRAMQFAQGKRSSGYDEIY